MSKPIVTHYDIDTHLSLKEKVRIAHVSDLHERNCDDIFAMLKASKPDIIMVTGDTLERYDNRPQYDVEHKPIKKIIINIIHYTNFVLAHLMPRPVKPNEENVHRFLQNATAVAPVYMSLGNHEQKLLPRDYRFLSDAGVHLLDNCDTTVIVGDFSFRLGGMSCWDYEDWLPHFLQQKGYKILLCHKPDFYVENLTSSDIDLTLSGHTHGGQMRIGKKGMGFFVPGQGIFGKYAHGSFFNDRLIVSAGCSNTVAFPRAFNPRELVVIDLH